MFKFKLFQVPGDMPELYGFNGLGFDDCVVFNALCPLTQETRLAIVERLFDSVLFTTTSPP